MALFLRYCAKCAQTSTMVAGGECEGCGGPLASVAAHSLIERLGHKLDVGQREDALAAALDEQLGGATTQSYNSGRRSYFRASAPKELYASELLDANTCTRCNGIDGEEWSTLAAAEESYPIGGYVDCEGGLRCRGTLVAVY